MQKKEYYKRTVMFLLSLGCLTLMTSLFALVWYHHYSDTIVQPFFRRGNWLVIGIYALLLFLVTHLYGGYRIGSLKRADVIYSAWLSLLFVNVVTYLQISLIGRDFMDAIPFVWMSFIQLVMVVVWAFSSYRLYCRLYPPRRMLLIYGSGQAESLIYKMATRKEKYQIQDIVSIDEDDKLIEKKMLLYDAVIFCDIKSERRSPLLKFCFSHSIRTYLTPKISDMIVRGAENIHLFDTPLLLCRNTGLNFEQRLAKRSLDILLSAMGILASWPIMLVLAAIIKIYDKGPMLYKQERTTIDGKTFVLYKFRSMVTDAEKNGVARLASENDERITPIGAFIRRIRFDELPQLFNILKGDMSVVGPRPERPELIRQYEEEMPEFAFRLKVKAGLTGYAQVMGKYNTTPYDKLKLDLMYIENYSFFMDLKLILMTIKILFVPDSTQGIVDNNSDIVEQLSRHEPDEKMAHTNTK